MNRASILTLSFLSAVLLTNTYAADVQEKQQELLEKQQEVREKQKELKQENRKELIERTHESNKAMQQVSRASKIIGTHVKNSNEENLGEINDLVLDPISGQLVYAVVSFGGIFGVGDKLFAVPWRVLSWAQDKGYFI